MKFLGLTQVVVMQGGTSDPRTIVLNAGSIVKVGEGPHGTTAITLNEEASLHVMETFDVVAEKLLGI